MTDITDDFIAAPAFTIVNPINVMLFNIKNVFPIDSLLPYSYSSYVTIDNNNMINNVIATSITPIRIFTNLLLNGFFKKT